MERNNNLKKELQVRRKEFTCQICETNEAAVKMESGSLRIKGDFCQPCALLRLEKFYDWNSEREQKIKLKRKWDKLLWKKQ